MCLSDKISVTHTVHVVYGSGCAELGEFKSALRPSSPGSWSRLAVSPVAGRETKNFSIGQEIIARESPRVWLQLLIFPS